MGGEPSCQEEERALRNGQFFTEVEAENIETPKRLTLSFVAFFVVVFFLLIRLTMTTNSVEDYCSTLEREIEENDDGLPSYYVMYQRAQLLQSQGLFLESLPVLVQAHEAVLHQKADFVAERLYYSISHLLANTLDYLGEHTKAEVIYLELIHDDPKGNHLCDYAVFLHRRKRDFDQAESYFRQALELYPNQSSTHLKFAGFLRHVRRNPTEANNHYIASVTANPQNSDALGSYASFLHGVIGNIEEAERYYITALQLDDTHANNLCNYGLFLR